ncbi:MAG: histidine phosphatase family protein [Algisphaera sp.]
MQLYFVRHAQSEGNANGYQSTIDHDQLSPLGQQQAQALAVRLKELTFDHIYVSPYRRTLQTIAPYLRQENRQAEIWPNLAEGCWQSDVDAPIPDRPGTPDPVNIPADLAELYRIPSEQNWLPWGEETYQEGCLRSVAARDELLERHSQSDATILTVGHFNSGNHMLESFLSMKHNKTFDHDNTGLSSLVQKECGAFSINFANRL